MRRTKTTGVFWMMLYLITQGGCTSPDPSIRAYYTKVPEGLEELQKHEEELFGKYNDILIDLNGIGTIEISRNSSFIPVWKVGDHEWKFEDIVKRAGDGTAGRPDKISRYAHARIIESSEEQVVVHCRYFPDFNSIEPEGVVDEYYTFYSDGKVVRSIKSGTAKYQDWITNVSKSTATYQLTKGGIDRIKDLVKSVVEVEQSIPAPDPGDTKEVSFELAFDFDEESGDFAKEGISEKGIPIEGHGPLRKTGIRGNGLLLDGYYSGIAVTEPFEEVQDFTLSGWLSLGAYPFGWAPIVQKSDWGISGYYLGIDENGFPGFHFKGKEGWVSVVDSNRLDLRKWHFITSTFEINQEVVLYVDGEKKASKSIRSNLMIPSADPLTIGLNSQPMPRIDGRIHIGKYPSLFGIDGLIDEVRQISGSMKPLDIKTQYSHTIERGISDSDLPTRTFPVLPDRDEFSAEYTQLSYHPSWDHLWRVGKHADIVVNFEDNPCKLVFWRGTSYGPFWVTDENQWIGDQSNEDYRELPFEGDAEGCLEHMSDKQCRHSFVRIVENHEARIVIHWRYGLVDSRYLFSPKNDGWGTWSDEYWTIYPDGSAIRHLARGKVFGDGWVETMFLSPPGETPDEQVEPEALTVISGEGERKDLSWANGSPDYISEDHLISMVNSKSDFRMYNIFPYGSGIEIFGGHSRRNSKFHWWNHWPVSQITSDGRGAKAADRMAHSSLAWGAPEGDYLIYGMSDKNPDEIIPKARFWNNAPVIGKLQGAESQGFAMEEGAYLLEATSDKISFELTPPDQSPIVNPAFVISDWSSTNYTFRINDSLPGKGLVKTGIPINMEGDKLVIWLNLETTEKVKIEIVPRKL